MCVVVLVKYPMCINVLLHEVVCTEWHCYIPAQGT